MAAKMFIFFILGVLLLIVGYILQVIEAGFGIRANTAYSLGVLSLAFYVYRNRDSLLLMFSRRSARYGAVSLAYILTFVGILALAGLFGERHHHRWDLTKNKTHSIALQSRQQLDRLNKDTLDLTINVFYRGEDDRRSKQSLIDLLDTYGYYTKHFKYELTDIDRNPLLAMQLEITSTSAIIITYGGKQEKIYSDQESKITNAMAKLLGGSAPGRKGTLFFVTGHGEPALTQGEAFNYGNAKAAVEEQIGPVRELLLATVKAVPDSCEILVVAGPEKDFLPAELESIAKYLGGGGKALFLVEPFMAEDLMPFLGRYGVKLGDDLVIDMLRGAVGSPFAFLVNKYPAHDITRYFDVGTVFDMARSVSPDSSLPAGISAEAFLKTSEKSYAEPDREQLQAHFDEVARKALDQGREVPIGVAVTLTGAALGKADTNKNIAAADSASGNMEKEARLVVIGDRDFISNAYLGQLGNRDLLLNCLRWLKGQSDQITIAPKETENTPLLLQRSDMLTMDLVGVVLLPLAIIFTGVFIRIRRRSKR